MTLAAADLFLSYGGSPVLKGLSLEFRAGESVAVVGPSGSGKSSLLYCLSGLERPTGGTVRLGDVDLAGLDDAARSELRLRRFGFVFQSADLVRELTLVENIALPLELAGVPRRKAMRRAGELVDGLDLGDSARRRPDQVSGGQAQRAAVARAVVAGPDVVFADEPTGALDSANRESVLRLLLEQTRQVGALLVMVTHDDHAAGAVDRVVGLADGQVTSDERALTLSPALADGPC